MVTRVCLLGTVGLLFACAALSAQETPAVDPLVKASPYGDQSVWSDHSEEPVPWSLFEPRDYGSARVDFDAEGVRPVGRVPAPGVHPRILFSREDLPTLRRRIHEDPAAQRAWLNVLAYAAALKRSYDKTAPYAQVRNGAAVNFVGDDYLADQGGERPAKDSVMNGDSLSPERLSGPLDGQPGRGRRHSPPSGTGGGESPTRFQGGPILKETAFDSVIDFFSAASTEALRCLVENDGEGAKPLIAAVVNAVKLEQARRARESKPVQPGQPPTLEFARGSRMGAVGLGFVDDFLFNWMTPEQQSAWSDNYGTFNHAETSRSNWATFSY